MKNTMKVRQSAVNTITAKRRRINKSMEFPGCFRSLFMNGKRIPVYLKKGLHPYGMQPLFVTSELGF